MNSSSRPCATEDRVRSSWRPVASSTGHPAYSGVFERERQSAGDAREMVRLVLDVWHLSALSDGLALIVTELVANACEHARGSVVRVTLTRTGRSCVRVAVTDKSRQHPTRMQVGPLAERGRGMNLVVGVAARWGVTPYQWGKSIWAEVEVP
ncbi:ATP-binding protein [Streptomyces sp. NPDC002309]